MADGQLLFSSVLNVDESDGEWQNSTRISFYMAASKYILNCTLSQSIILIALAA